MPETMLNRNSRPAPIEALIQDISVSGAVLDAQGTILEVSHGWRQLADRSGLSLGNYGIGTSYLKYCVFPEARSAEILRGLRGVLSKSIDCFSTLYPCDGHGWYLMVAFASEDDQPTSTVLHLDVSRLLRDPEQPSAAMIGLGPAATDHLHEAMVSTVRRAIAENLTRSGGREPPPTVNAADQRKLGRLSPAQFSILRRLATGASNAEIARDEGLSLSAVKTQTATLIRKLGFVNRTQAALFAARNGITSEMETADDDAG
jgi:DNA-binding CsgD family transcriptional regulator